MIEIERTCCKPFVNVILRCDICSKISSGDGFHVVSLVDGRTICKTCFCDVAKGAESK